MLIIAVVGCLSMLIFVIVKYFTNRKKKKLVRKLAHDYCMKNNIPWQGNVGIYREGKNWVVFTTGDNSGDRVMVLIDNETEEIVEVGKNTL